jgi:hypothetical protein
VPARAGIDPYDKLIMRERQRAVVTLPQVV